MSTPSAPSALETALDTALEGEHPEVVSAIQALAQLDHARASDRTIARRTRAALNAGASAELIRLALGGPV